MVAKQQWLKIIFALANGLAIQMIIFFFLGSTGV
jgi:hypothetical protein